MNKYNEFSATFTLLLQEGGLAQGTLATGLTTLRNAELPEKSNFYSGFFNTSTSLERIMKLIVISDYMLDHSFDAPSVKDLKSYGHNLEALYLSCVAIGKKHDISHVNRFKKETVELNILSFFSDFAKGSRYYNLDELSGNGNLKNDPLNRWGNILDKIYENDVPVKIKEKKNLEVKMHYSMIKDSVNANQMGMDGKPMTIFDCIDFPAKQKLATPYLMPYIFNILRPLVKILGVLTKETFYSKGGPYTPLLAEFFLDFDGSESQIRNKKRWP
ncbi:hypothetical protein [Marinicellulosiphila megalodicopiae]|uniref:hypothetical protein n=1 Tax=Marinicellulosiphila megalodicopiae TaxID=2724896 RepID=UPI003BAF9214